jgi:hypothetical protein
MTNKDEEVYELITKFNFDDERINEAVQNHVALLKKKGDDFTWNVITNGKSNFILTSEIKENTQETAPEEQIYHNKPKYNKNNKKPRYNNYQDKVFDENTNFEQRRGHRGARRGRTRGANRGFRGGRKNFEGEFVETHFDQEQNLPVNSQIVNNETIPEDTTANVIHTNVENLIQDTPDSKANHTHTLEPNHIITTSSINNIDSTPLSVNNNNNTAPTNVNQAHVIQNVETLFQKFTLERETEVHKLLEDKKVTKQERDPKQFYEECVNHFVRDNQISRENSFLLKPTVKPATTSKNTINSQPQVSLSQSQTTQPTTSSSTNKNFPHKGFNQQQQGPDSYFNQQNMMNMYPFMFPQHTGEPNMTSPQMFPQMMNPQMFYFMNQMVRTSSKISISSNNTL